MCIAFLIIAKYCDTRDHILILNILFFNKLRQIIPEIRSERRDLLIFIFILKTTGTFTPVHSAGYLISFLIIAKDCDTCIQVFGQSPVDRL
jgi:hypothetical protein